MKDALSQTWCVKRGFVLLNMIAVFVALAFSAGGGNSPKYDAGYFVYFKALFLAMPIFTMAVLFLSRPTSMKHTLAKIVGENKYFIFYLIACFFSIPLAVNAGYSLSRLLYTCFGTLSIFSLVIQYDVLFMDKARMCVLQRHIKALTVIALMIFAGALFYHMPDTIVPGVRNAISQFRIIHPNILAGFFCYLLIWNISGQYLGQQPSLWLNGALTVLLSAAVVCLFSRSIFAAFFTCFSVSSLLCFLWYRKSLPFLMLLSLLCMAGFVVLASVVSGFVTLDGVLGVISRDDNIDSLYTLTNRTELWSILLSNFEFRKALLGFGYSVMTPDFGVDFGTGILYGAHNAYLAIFLGNGVIALAFYILFLVSMIIQTVKKRHVIPSFYVMALIASSVLLIVSGCLSEEVGLNTTLTFAFFLLIKTACGVFYSGAR